MGQIVEKPRRDLEKVLPREDLKPRDVLKANPRAQGLPSEQGKGKISEHCALPAMVKVVFRRYSQAN